MATANEWEKVVKKGEDICVGCNTRFRPEQDIITALELTETGFSRRDLCTACFERSETTPFSFWRHRLLHGATTRPRRLDLAYLAEFFKRLDGREDETSVRLQYIVALLLLRRRLLEELGREGSPGNEWMNLRSKKEEREYRVRIPDLSGDAMVAIERDLGQVFNLEAGTESTPKTT